MLGDQRIFILISMNGSAGSLLINKSSIKKKTLVQDSGKFQWIYNK